MPLNKNIWTSSFALFAGGCALCGLAACWWLVEVRALRAWGKPFAIFGRNALVSYFLSEFVFGLQMFFQLPKAGGGRVELRVWLDSKLFGWLSPPNASLAYSVCILLSCLSVAWLLHRKRIFIKI
jgi:predicted acyltransferase